VVKEEQEIGSDGYSEERQKKESWLYHWRLDGEKMLTGSKIVNWMQCRFFSPPLQDFISFFLHIPRKGYKTK